MTKKESNIIQSLMYIQGDEGLTPNMIKGPLEKSIPESRKLLLAFQTQYNKNESGLEVVEYKDNFKFRTRIEFKEYITKMITIEKKRKLSQSAVETAGIIAYKQPITKSQINLIRGVSSEGVVHTLLIKGLIEEKGHADSPGNPTLYGITNKFYDYFNISSLKELPTLSELTDPEDVESINLFASQRQD